MRPGHHCCSKTKPLPLKELWPLVLLLLRNPLHVPPETDLALLASAFKDKSWPSLVLEPFARAL